MISMSYRKFINGLGISCLFIVIILPDIVFGWLFELLHFLLELVVEFADILFEWIESSLDKVVEHTFHTDLHDTQIIVFYIMMSVLGYGIYRVTRVMPRYYEWSKEKLIFAWLFNKTRVFFYWQTMSLMEKIKLISIIAVAIGGFITLNM
jgi:hypothetical protein